MSEPSLFDKETITTSDLGELVKTAINQIEGYETASVVYLLPEGPPLGLFFTVMRDGHAPKNGYISRQHMLEHKRLCMLVELAKWRLKL